MSSVKPIITDGALGAIIQGTAKKEDLTRTYDRSTQTRRENIAQPIVTDGAIGAIIGYTAKKTAKTPQRERERVLMALTPKQAAERERARAQTFSEELTR
ncbi:MAG: hypothetical protein LBL15_01015, partial [Oscillospiraceae bacterium]|nr:hypothetical protein [Oscillospiraceae bacterium]